MKKDQQELYISTADWVLHHNPKEKLNRCFEMSIDMCEWVDWDQEKECGAIWDLLLKERGLEGCFNNKVFTGRLRK